MEPIYANRDLGSKMESIPNRGLSSILLSTGLCSGRRFHSAVGGEALGCSSPPHMARDARPRFVGSSSGSGRMRPGGLLGRSHTPLASIIADDSYMAEISAFATLRLGGKQDCLAIPPL
jgi:hypothetical protein